MELLRTLRSWMRSTRPDTSRAREAPNGRIGRVRVGLVTIIDEEFTAAQKVFDLHEHLGRGYFVRKNGKAPWDVALMQATDRSNIPVAGDVKNFMEDLRPQVLVLVGIAGGMCDGQIGRDGIGPGDVVLANQVSYVEFLKLSHGQPPRMRSYAIDHPSVPLRRNVSIPISKQFKLSERVQFAPPAQRETKIHIGEIVSGEKVMGDVSSHVQKGLLDPFDKALAVDMESIGMARAVCDGRDSLWYHPRYTVIRGISDLVADQENNAQRDDWKRFAAHAAAVVAQEFVRMLPEDP